MLSVRIDGHTYRISNETLDQLFADWREAMRRNIGLLENSIRTQHAAGKLVIQGQRLRLASAIEQAEHRLLSAEDADEILRSGFLHAAAQLAALASEVRALRESLEFDTSAADATLSRDRSEIPGPTKH
jgi:hypothetical protein